MAENNEDAEKILYEIGYLLDPAFSADLVAETVKIKDVITRLGGAISYEDSPKMKDLAYTVMKPDQGKYKRYNNAYFGYIRFNIEKKDAEALSNAVKKIDSIIRFIVIKIEKEIPRSAPRFSYLSSDERIKAKKVQEPRSADEAKLVEEEIDKTIEELVV